MKGTTIYFISCVHLLCSLNMNILNWVGLKKITCSSLFAVQHFKAGFSSARMFSALHHKSQSLKTGPVFISHLAVNPAGFELVSKSLEAQIVHNQVPECLWKSYSHTFCSDRCYNSLGSWLIYLQRSWNKQNLGVCLHSLHYNLFIRWILRFLRIMNTDLCQLNWVEHMDFPQKKKRTSILSLKHCHLTAS